MLTAKTVKIWYAVHKWTSLVCTVFLLLLCLTGLPLIFIHELSHLLGGEVEAASVAPGTPQKSLDELVDAAREKYPDEYARFLVWDDDEPGLVFVTFVPSRYDMSNEFKSIAVDVQTGDVTQFPELNKFLDIMFHLHVDLFAGLYGTLFLGFMGLLFVASLVSGAVLYGPFMRKLDFGVVRKERAARLKWLDLHNLLGIVTLTWAFVVGGTGVINTLAEIVLAAWQSGQLAEMVEPYKNSPPAVDFSSIDAAVETAYKAAPGMTPSFMAFPGPSFSSDHHYTVFMRGETPLTSRLLRPVLVDAETSEFTDSRTLPWWVTALLVSQPLHFGDYGGMPMKIIWAVLDVITIVVLASGLYLWLSHRKRPIEERILELERNEALAKGGLRQEEAL